MDKMVWKKYFGVTNVIVRLSDGTAATKANAVLVNAHTDSTLPSPGAADDLFGVAVMLEAMRVMALGERRLTNSVIFRASLSLSSPSLTHSLSARTDSRQPCSVQRR